MRASAASGVELREAYREFCLRHPDIPLFGQSWWLDAVSPDTWAATVSERRGMSASLPYLIRRRYGLAFSAQPPLTQSLGPWYGASDPRTKGANLASASRDAARALIADLPKFHYFRQNWDPSQTDWLPFYWAGFTATSRFTYRLDTTVPLEAIWAEFRGNVRTAIRKAEAGPNALTVHEASNPECLITMNRAGLARRGARVPYADETVRRVFSAALERGQGRLLEARDSSGTPHGAVLLVWDDKVTYYLMAATTDEGRARGANVQLVWVAIQLASSVSPIFDFEGSMIESIERFVRSFGPKQVPYLALTKTANRSLAAAHALAVNGR